MTETADPHDEIRARLEHYRQFLSADDYVRLVASLQHPRRSALRVNTLKIDEVTARDRWPTWYGWDIEPVPFCAAGWQILRQDQRLGDTLEFQHGYYYIQDAASMLPAELFSDQAAPLILDLAAAPGGKTTHLASRFGDSAMIVANDTSQKRITALRSNLQTWGALGVLLTNAPGEKLGRWFPETFDKVLLDAPCSGDTLRLTTGRRTRDVSDTERAQLCQRQSALLESAFQAVRPGGEIVYATCTMAPEEDEAVLDGLLRAYPGAAHIDTLDHVPVSAPGLGLDGADPQVTHAIRLWPHLYQTSGFFTARISKTATLDVPPDERPFRPWSASGWQALPPDAVQTIIARLRDEFGFDLGSLLDTHDLTLWQRDKSIFVIPATIKRQFANLPNAGMGFLIGQLEDTKKGADATFIPAHELITRYEDQFAAQRLSLGSDQVTIWLQGRDLRGIAAGSYPAGTVILLEDERGRFIGRGKVQRDRIRNLLPRRLTQ